MLPRAVIDQTPRYFPAVAGKDFSATPLEKGGSDRQFYRVGNGSGPTVILVKYSRQKEENRHYVTLAEFLASAGVRVPQIYFHDSNEGLIWMQDLGEVDLWASRQESWQIRRPLYESALREVARMHTTATLKLNGAQLPLEKEFSDQLYLWEQGYFFENCLRGHFGLSETEVTRHATSPVLHHLACDLAARPRTLVHRDFQSQNILVCAGDAWLIDFQGMRPGLPQYDLASLLYDPYVTLTDPERVALRDFYKTTAGEAGMEIASDFDSVLDRCALQRLMQALGAYGFLGLKKGRTDFLSHIPTARQSLCEVASRIDGLEDFVTLLKTLP